MEASSKDAEELNLLTIKIKNDSEYSAKMAETISKIDSEITEIIHEQIHSLNNSAHPVTNEDLLSELQNARLSHKAWLSKLKEKNKPLLAVFNNYENKELEKILTPEDHVIIYKMTANK